MSTGWNRPVLQAKTSNPRELRRVRCHKRGFVTERLAGYQEVVSANWFAEPFQGCTNPSRVLGVFWGEVQNLKRTGQEGRDSFGIRFRALALSNSVPELEKHNRRSGDHVVTSADASKTSPHRFWPTIDQRNTSVGIEQVGQSRTLREGVIG